ncbi:zinc finger protein 2 homolog [Argonauta hians]
MNMRRQQCADDTWSSNCTVCGKSFVHECRSATSSTCSSEQTTPSVMMHSCEVCGKNFSQADQLSNHSKIHMKNSSPNCKVCGKSFLQHEPFNQHITTHDVVKALHICPICDQSFHEEGLLRSHMKSHKKDTQCQVCTKSFF